MSLARRLFSDVYLADTVTTTLTGERYMHSVRAHRRVLAATAAASLALVTLGGAAAADDEPNEQPTVVPELQEWTGETGHFRLDDTSRIVVDDDSAEVGAQLAVDLAELTGRSLPVTEEAPADGDVVLAVDASASHPEGGEDFTREGYLLDIGETATITAPTETGVFYGTRSILQVLLQSGDRSTLPRGVSADWPDHESRGFMLDVGRRFFTPEFVRDYIAMMSWYKLNEFQIHLNDNEIFPVDNDWSRAYSGFRLATDNPDFAGLASEDGAYDREDWQSFEDAAAAHHMMIIPEIDAPAHARAIIEWKPELGRNGGDSDLLDLGNPESTETMKDIWSEFIPWFEGPDVHIGTDEYPHHLADDFRDFFNAMAEHVRSEGKHPRAWGSFNVMHPEAEGYDRDVTINSWNNGYYGLEDAERDGYEFINTNDGTLYVVPFADYYHGYGLNNGWLYSSWLPNTAGDHTVPADSPMGAMFAVWNDLVHEEYTELDVHGLVRDSFPVIAQKTWKAEQPNLSYADFSATLATIGQGPGLEVIAEGEPVDGELGFGAEVTASAADEQHPAAHLTDGRATTRWQDSSGDPATLTVDLGEPTTVGAVEVDWTADAAAGYAVEVSTDGVFWQHVADHVPAGTAGIDRVTFPAHDARYVRLAEVTPAGDAVGAWRLSVLGTPDLALGKPATAVGVEAGTDFVADNVTDGSSATRWSSSYVDPAWIYVDLEEPTVVDSVRLAWEGGSAVDYTVDVSADAESWETVATRTAMPTGARTDDVTFDPVTARYVRVHVTEKSIDPYLSIFDFEVRSSAPAPLTIAAELDQTAGDGGWITEQPTLTLTAGGSGTGEAELEYRVGEGEWTSYSAPVALDAQGATTIEYRGTRGEDSARGYGAVRIDTAAPVTSIVTDPADGRAVAPAAVSVTLTADDDGSGVVGTEYRVDDGPWVAWDGEPIVLAEIGDHRVAARSTDAVGHVEEAVTASISVLPEDAGPAPTPPEETPDEPTPPTGPDLPGAGDDAPGGGDPDAGDPAGSGPAASSGTSLPRTGVTVTAAAVAALLLLAAGGTLLLRRSA